MGNILPQWTAMIDGHRFLVHLGFSKLASRCIAIKLCIAFHAYWKDVSI